jgi:nucleotidyltransferase substrate binding protein (TIGR01987 family)
LKNLKKPLISLEAIYLQQTRKDRSNIDATIQRFEFTFELAWKFLKDYFQARDIQLHYPKEVIMGAFAVGLIEDENIWIQMLKDCNVTSHTYDEKLADEIYTHIKKYVPQLPHLIDSVT